MTCSVNFIPESELRVDAGNSLLHRFSFRSTLLGILAGWLALLTTPQLCSQDSSDSDAFFVRAIQEYNENHFTSARSDFEKVQGTHSGEAKQYLAKIKAYTEDIQIALGVTERATEELDAPSLEFAVQKLQDAIKIKPDGPWNPAQQLEKAKSLHEQVVQQHSKNKDTLERGLCAKAAGAAQEHHYKEAQLLSCALANDDPGYLCEGDEAVHMCQQMGELAAMGSSPQPASPESHVNTGGSSDVLEKAKAAYNKNDFETSRTLFARAPSDSKREADEYLDKISRYQGSMAQGEKLSQSGAYEDARIAFAGAVNIKPDGPGNPRAKALLMQLEAGIDQFYSGDYVSAQHNLEGYARDGAERLPIALFYLGASKLARFFITGNQDASLKQDALTDLKMAKQAGYRPNARDISPKILQAYNEL